MMIRSGLLVLDVDGLTLRCRSCDWVSPTCTAVEEAARAFAIHACPDREIASTCPSGQIDMGGRVGAPETASSPCESPHRRSRVRNNG
jgi:hypothetical protein